MNKVSRMGLRPPAMLARFMDEPLLQVIGATPTRAAIERADFGQASEDHLSVLRADAFARAQETGFFGQNGGGSAMWASMTCWMASIWLSRTSITAPIEASTLASWA